MTEGLTPQSEVELEIAAFMGPHIKRARIVLAVAGALYCIAGYMDYSAVADARSWLKHVTDGAPMTPEIEHMQHVVNVAYLVVVSAIVAGIANIVLAAIAGTKTMIAFYAAVAIFGAFSLIQIYASGGLLLTSWIWWLTAIVVGMGFQAALKAERLRRAAPVTSPALA